MNRLTEQQKVKALYNLIGERGLYVSTNYDIFTQKPEEVSFGINSSYKIPLIQPGTSAYASPLLFAALTCLLNHGTMLLRGAPGIGKTTSAEFTGHFFSNIGLGSILPSERLENILSAEIQGHPQLTEEKIVASYELGKLVTTGEREVLPTKFLECQVKILDEINRCPADILSIIMKLVDTGNAVYGGRLLKSPPGPLFATANYDDEGTFQLTPPFLDRFDVAVMVTSPQPWDLKKIIKRGDEKLNGNLERLLDVPEDLKLDLDRIRREISNIPEEFDNEIPVATNFIDFFYGSLRFSEAASKNLVRATKGNAWRFKDDNMPVDNAPGNTSLGHFKDAPFNYTKSESSIRAYKAIHSYSKAFAWFSGKDYVGLADTKAILPYLLWHKIEPSQQVLTENPIFNNDRIGFIEYLIEKVDMSYNEMMSNSEMVEAYSFALYAVKNNKIGDKDLSLDEVREIVKKTISKLNEVDKHYAITMAFHVATEFNERVNGQR